jgi:hypothetical protein
MIELGNGSQQEADHIVGSDQMIEIGVGGQRVELFGVQLPGGRRSRDPNHKRAAPPLGRDHPHVRHRHRRGAVETADGERGNQQGGLRLRWAKLCQSRSGWLGVHLVRHGSDGCGWRSIDE